MKKSISFLSAFIFLTTFSSAALAKKDYASVPKVSKPGIFTYWVEWVKDKGDKYDYRLHLENDSSDKDLIVRVNHIECYRGDQRGRTKNRYLKTPAMSVPLYPGQKLDFNSFCYFNEKTTGPFKIIVKRVYDNPSQDGFTPGKIIATDLTWTSPKE